MVMVPIAHGQTYFGEATFPTVEYSQTFFPSDPDGPGQIEVTCTGTSSVGYQDMVVRLSPSSITFTIVGARTNVTGTDDRFCNDSEDSFPFEVANVTVTDAGVAGQNNAGTLFIDLLFNEDRTSLQGTVFESSGFGGQQIGQVNLALSSPAGPAGVADGILAWLRSDTGISAADGESVFTWIDQSGQGNNALWNAFNAFGELPPILDASNPAAAGQPTVRFNGQNALELDLTGLAGSDYTIFVVNARDRFGLANFYIAGDTAVPNQNLTLGYEQVSLLRQAHFNNDLDALVPAYTGTPLWALDTFVFDQAVGRTIYQEGSLLAADSNTIPLMSNTGTTLGHFRAFGNIFWFQGDLAEVVVYDRALSDSERRRVESELAGRYGRPYDLDFDTVLDDEDNCPSVPNADQEDSNEDGFGDACVPPDTVIAKGVSIGSNPVFGAGVVVAKNTAIGANARIGMSVVIAKDSILGDNVVIDDQSEIKKGAEIGDNVSIGANVTIAKNARIGDGAQIGNGTVIAKDAIIGPGASIGSNVTINKGATILPGALVQNGTVVPKDSTFPSS